jgi:dTDP-glucose pyrophosphorylase
MLPYGYRNEYVEVDKIWLDLGMPQSIIETRRFITDGKRRG